MAVDSAAVIAVAEARLVELAAREDELLDPGFPQDSSAVQMLAIREEQGRLARGIALHRAMLGQAAS